MNDTDELNPIEIIDDETEVVAFRGSKLERLEAEGDIAADYLEELLDIADLDGDIEIDVENGRALVEITTEDSDPDRRLKRLVGRHGEVLESLQELTRLAVQSQTGERSRLMLDIVGYRRHRREDLRALVEELAQEVRETGEPVKMKPMNPFERKVCHDMASELGLFSDSEGVAPKRYVVLSLTERAASSDDEPDDFADTDSPSADIAEQD